MLLYNNLQIRKCQLFDGSTYKNSLLVKLIFYII